MKLDILFQISDRSYIANISRKFLKESLPSSSKFIDHINTIELDCSNKSIGKGFNELVEKATEEYCIWTPDDFGFFPNGNWIDEAINILENRKDIGIIDLRKEQDGETPWMIDKRDYIGNQSYFVVRRWADREFNLTPFMMRTADLKKIIPLDDTETRKNGAEYSGIENYKINVGLKIARLDIPYMGVCFHLGWNRSQALGYKEKL